MTTTAYTLNAVEDEQGVIRTTEALWTPTPDEAVKNGFINHHGLILAGVGEESEPPAEFVALGHGHTWTAIYQAAAAYMQRTGAGSTSTASLARSRPPNRHAPPSRSSGTPCSSATPTPTSPAAANGTGHGASPTWTPTSLEPPRSPSCATRR